MSAELNVYSIIVICQAIRQQRRGLIITTIKWVFVSGGRFRRRNRQSSLVEVN